MEHTLLDTIIHRLKEGAVVAAPTDTVYGLLADATNEKAVAKVVIIKARGEEKGMPIFISSLASAKKIAMIKNDYEPFLRAIWPGKVTVILPLKPEAPIAKNALAGDGTIALRVPAHPLILRILRSIKKPLTGTSANYSGLAPCRDSACIKEQLAGHLPDFIVEGKALPPSEASTIVNLTGTEPRILREGAEYDKVNTALKAYYGKIT